MKQVLRDVLLFCGLIAALLSALTMATDHGLQSMRRGIYQPWNENREGVNAEILVVGNSHALVQISSPVLAQRLGKKVYNIGMPGYPFDMQYARYRFYRTYNTAPEMILLTVDLNEFSVTDNFNDQEQFLPYLGNKGFDDTPLPPHYSLYRYLPFLKYQEQTGLVKMAVGQLVSASQPDTSFYKGGYHGWDKSWDPAAFNAYLKEHPYVLPKMNRSVYNLFLSFIDECRRQHTRVVLVATPYYHRYRDIMCYRDAYYNALRDTARKLQIGYVDFVKDPIARDSNSYYNANHLNRAGAERLTSQLADSLIRMEATR